MTLSQWQMVVKAQQMLKEAHNAKTYTIPVHDPLHRNIEASYARSQDNQVAIIEMAASSD